MPAESLSPHRIAVTALLCAGLLALGALWRGHVERVRAAEGLAAPAATPQGAGNTAPQPRTLRTRHFAIESTASEADTAQVGDAAEALHASWTDFFAHELAQGEARAPEAEPRPSDAPLRMRLYASQAEFKAHNRSRPWAEAFYLRPLSHAYISRGRGNRHHWMLHEVVHQLNTEVLGRRHPRWIEEGLACYFGGSRLVDGVLRPGDIDATTYPAWWLPNYALGDDRAQDDRAQDIRRLRMIPLRAMLTGQDVPPLDANVNLHYVQHWTLVHFLLHGDGGQHAAGFRALMATQAGLEEFERLIGPVDVIESRWRAHRGVMLANMRADAASGGRSASTSGRIQTREYDQDTIRPSR